MKIYTRTGDSGTTGLFGGDRVAKDHVRIEAYGTVDELNSVLGLVRSSLPGASSGTHFGDQTTGEGAAASPETDSIQKLDRWLERIQSELFDLGADLATPMDSRAEARRIPTTWVERIEREIDKFDAALKPLKVFILPGGHLASAHLHVARTLCRRAERRVHTLSNEYGINEVCLVYLNRLSDALFTAARWMNHTTGIADAEWRPSKSKP